MKRYHVSANLWDEQSLRGYYSSTGEFVSNSLQICTENKIAVQPNTQYWLGVPTSGTRIGLAICTYDSNEVFIERYVLSGYLGSGTEYTTNANTYYININFTTVYGYPYKSDIIIAKGSERNYEPYGNEWQTKSPPNYGTGTDVVTNLPVTLYTDGQPVSSYTLKGNTSVSGTPSPSNPVTIDGVGNKTANLLNIAQPIVISAPSYVYSGDFTFSGESITYKATFYCSIAMVDNNDNEIINRAVSANTALTVSTPNGIKSLRIYTPNAISEGYVMINAGSEALPYEPYGYKISILKDSQPLTPIYLSQPLRKSLDGTAFDTLDSTGLVTYNVDEYGQPQTATTETVTVPTITTTGGTVTLDVDTTIKPSEMSLTYHGWHEHQPLKRENGAWV